MLVELQRIRDYYSQFPFIRRSAIKFGAPKSNDDVDGMVSNLTQFVRSKMRYVEDPVGYELVTAPDVLLADILQNGFATGDCDDHVLLLNTLLMSVGVPTNFAAVRISRESEYYDHVISIVQVRGVMKQIDPTARFRLAPQHDDLYMI